jgi:HEAT repeat protein
MFNWLRRLWRTRNPETQKQKQGPALTGQDGTSGSAGQEVRQGSQASPVPSERREPVLVRGRFWKDTSETRWQLARTPEASGDSSIDDLIRRLARADDVKVRRSAAEELAQLGPAGTPALSALLNSAVDVDAAVREAALNALNAIDPSWPNNAESRKAFPDLVAALGSWFSDVSRAAFRLLDLIGPPAVPDLVNALSNEEDTVDKVQVMRLLAKLGPGAASAVPGLTRTLGSQSLPVRIAAAEALASIGPAAETAVPTLVVGLADPFSDGRQAMAACLACVGAAAEPAVPALLPLLADREDRVRQAAAAALAQIGPKAVPALIKVVQTRDMRRFSALIEAMIKVSPWYVRLRSDVGWEDPEKAFQSLSWAAYEIMQERASLEAAHVAALGVLGEFGPAASAAMPAVAQALADPNPDIKLAAVHALERIGLEASVGPDLIRMLVHSNESLRKAAIKALGKTDRDWMANPVLTSAIAGLAKRLSRAGRSGEIAVQAFAAIGAAAVPVLIDVLESGDRMARENAARALGRIGVGAKAAIPALTRALEDNHRWVQEEAARALAEIDDYAA